MTFGQRKRTTGPSYRASRPGRAVEVYRRAGTQHHDLLVILWNETIGVHSHILALGATRDDAVAAAEHITHR